MEISRNTSQALHTVLGVSGFFGARMFLLNEITARKKKRTRESPLSRLQGNYRKLFWGVTDLLGVVICINTVSTLRPDSSQEAKEL